MKRELPKWFVQRVCFFKQRISRELFPERFVFSNSVFQESRPQRDVCFQTAPFKRELFPEKFVSKQCLSREFLERVSFQTALCRVRYFKLYLGSAAVGPRGLFLFRDSTAARFRIIERLIELCKYVQKHFSKKPPAWVAGFHSGLAVALNFNGSGNRGLMLEVPACCESSPFLTLNSKAAPFKEICFSNTAFQESCFLRERGSLQTLRFQGETR